MTASWSAGDCNHVIVEGVHYNRRELKYNPEADPSRVLTKEDLIFGDDTQPANEEADEEQSEARDLSDGVN